ncbi:hypothetical protein LGK95_01205 [Clostridium algoriphilum]|uniref:hypothetical protein n=1 Tax=Clostridium algoriphilum TaxID=198347 RepID=UPI001CF1DB4A|nr:hypothetical protein [Clostridium algoriphilum]MCB2292155.1 hypothetical protein [Clostridium algoriphilum]
MKITQIIFLLSLGISNYKFINAEESELNIDLIRDKDKSLYIGYCISTINKDLT